MSENKDQLYELNENGWKELEKTNLKYTLKQKEFEEGKSPKEIKKNFEEAGIDFDELYKILTKKFRPF